MVKGAHPDLLAEMSCDLCNRRKWIGYANRYNGRPGCEGSKYCREARCDVCPSGKDYMTWTGNIKVKD